MSDEKNLNDDLKETASEFANGAKETFAKTGGDNKKILAGVLAIFLGALGVHKFILGYKRRYYYTCNNFNPRNSYLRYCWLGYEHFRFNRRDYLPN